METVPRIAQLRTWLILSLLLHLLFTLFLATRKMVEGIQLPSIIFLPEQKQRISQQQSSAAQPQPTQPHQQAPIQQPAPQPQAPDEETVQFYLDLHKRSQFGYGAQVKLTEGEPGGDDTDEPAETEDSVTKDPQAYPEKEQLKDSAQKSMQQNSQTKTPSHDEQSSDAKSQDKDDSAHTSDSPAKKESNSPTLTEQAVQALQEISALSQEEAVFLEAARTLMKKKEEKKAEDHKQDSSTTVYHSRLNQSTSKGGSPGKKSKLGRLFEGYIDYMNDPRREEVINYHQPDKRYASYMRKVGWALQNSFYLHNRPVTMDHSLHMQATFILEIARDGSLQKLTITPETALPLQQHITKIIGKAAPFAPLPSEFKRTHMKIEMPVVIDAQQGTHTYYLQF